MQKFQALTGMVIDPALFQQAFDDREIVAYTKLDEDQIRKVSKTLFRLKVIPTDTTQPLLQRLDYTFLVKATGQTPQQLGKTSQ
jgi:hypothetical protein